MKRTPLEQALEAAPFEGNQSRFAEAIGTSQQNISNWLRKKRPLPAEFVIKAELVTGIARFVWRPDIYPPEVNDAPDHPTSSSGKGDEVSHATPRAGSAAA